MSATLASVAPLSLIFAMSFAPAVTQAANFARASFGKLAYSQRGERNQGPDQRLRYQGRRGLRAGRPHRQGTRSDRRQRELTDVVHEISAASNEQASGIEQVGNAIAQLDRSTQENAALVEESAAAAETLSRQSAEMVQAAAVFKLADDGRSKSHTSGYDSGASQRQSWHESPAEHSSRIAA